MCVKSLFMVICYSSKQKINTTPMWSFPPFPNNYWSTFRSTDLPILGIYSIMSIKSGHETKFLSLVILLVFRIMETYVFTEWQDLGRAWLICLGKKVAILLICTNSTTTTTKDYPNEDKCLNYLWSMTTPSREMVWFELYSEVLWTNYILCHLSTLAMSISRCVLPRLELRCPISPWHCIDFYASLFFSFKLFSKYSKITVTGEWQVNNYCHRWLMGEN